MKGLRLVIPPFAPDQSGAAGVFCMLPGLIVILDAGGCAGNICGFDEPRWFGSRSAIFSAGLRDMDAILGRDDKLVDKIAKACERIRASFVAVIGTPVPAVIATDYRAVGRMIQKRTGLPVMMVDTDGTAYYDEGEKKAWKALAETLTPPAGREYPGTDRGGVFAEERDSSGNSRFDDANAHAVGVLGLTPLSFHRDFTEDEAERIKESVRRRESCEEVFLYTVTNGMETAARVCKNLVVSPTAVPAAEALKKKYGTPYEIWCDPAWVTDTGEMLRMAEKLAPERVLVVHQQVLANEIRSLIREKTGARVDAAGWFSMERDLKEEGDRLLREEEDWISMIREGRYDLIVADELLARAVPDYSGAWWDLPHFALSGRARI